MNGVVIELSEVPAVWGVNLTAGPEQFVGLRLLSQCATLKEWMEERNVDVAGAVQTARKQKEERDAAARAEAAAIKRTDEVWKSMASWAAKEANAARAAKAKATRAANKAAKLRKAAEAKAAEAKAKPPKMRLYERIIRVPATRQIVYNPQLSFLEHLGFELVGKRVEMMDLTAESDSEN